MPDIAPKMDMEAATRLQLPNAFSLRVISESPLSNLRGIAGFSDTRTQRELHTWLEQLIFTTLIFNSGKCYALYLTGTSRLFPPARWRVSSVCFYEGGKTEVLSPGKRSAEGLESCLNAISARWTAPIPAEGEGAW